MSENVAAQRPLPHWNLFAHLLALLAQQFHGFVDNLRRDIERGTETNRAFARFQNQDSAIEQTLPEFIARFRIG